MKVYQVTLPYFDGDHDHGMYNSPLFMNIQDAENFLDQVRADKTLGPKSWDTDNVSGEKIPTIITMEVQEWPIEATSWANYLDIHFT